MSRKNKWKYLWVVQFYTPDYGWEDVDEGDAKDRIGRNNSLKEHRMAYRGYGYPVRSINRRELA